MPRPCPRKHPTSYLSPPNCSAMQIAPFSECAVWLEHIFPCTGHGIGNSLSLRSAPCHAGVEVSHGIRSRAPFLRACLCSVSSAKEKKETWQALIPSAWMCCDRLQAEALQAVCVPIFWGIFCFSSTSPSYPSAKVLRAQIVDSFNSGMLK